MDVGNLSKVVFSMDMAQMHRKQNTYPHVRHRKITLFAHRNDGVILRA